MMGLYDAYAVDMKKELIMFHDQVVARDEREAKKKTGIPIEKIPNVKCFVGRIKVKEVI